MIFTIKLLLKKKRRYPDFHYFIPFVISSEFTMHYCQNNFFDVFSFKFAVLIAVLIKQISERQGYVIELLLLIESERISINIAM